MITDYAIFAGVPLDQVQDLFVGGCFIGDPHKTTAKKWCGLATVVSAAETEWLADTPDGCKLVAVWATQTGEESYSCRPVYVKLNVMEQLQWRIDNQKSEPKDNYARMRWYKDRCAAMRSAIGQSHQRVQAMSRLVEAMDKLYTDENPEADMLSSQVLARYKAANNTDQPELGLDPEPTQS